jgi:hypothetical protein
MSASEYGHIISSNEWYVVRQKIDENGSLRLFVHTKMDGKEYRPLGYLLGSNALIYEKKVSHVAPDPSPIV